MYKKIKTQLLTRLSIIVSVAVLFVGSFAVPFVSSTRMALSQSASDLRNQSNNLQAQIDANKATAEGLTVEVNTLQGKIAELDEDINTTQGKISETEQKIAVLRDDLIKTEAELERQKGILRSNLKQLYKTTGATSVELIFASDDFSSFINEQEYLDELKNGVKSSLDNMIVLKKDLEAKKAEQEVLQQGLELRKKDLEDSRIERSSLLTQTQGEEVKYQAIVADLQAQQKEINRKISALSTSINYAGTGSYPWANVAEGYWTPLADFGSDPWSMGYRQCVSYTAWKVASTGRYMPRDWNNGAGNAINWPRNAREIGIPVDQTPQPGDIAILMIGYYGHAMYVEDVYSNGTMRISQYNLNWDGRYSEMTMASYRSDMYFIHFPY